MLARAPSRRPQQNGRHERLHLTLKQETATPDLRRQIERFRDFQRVYNFERPHAALGGTVLPPAPGKPPCPDDAERRRVRRSGEIKWKGSLIYINQALAGEPSR